jgi:peptidyl-prolyl cis-trans isomerase SurA
MMTRAKTAWWLAMGLVAMTCAAKQQPQTGTAPQSAGPQGTGAQGISPQGTPPATAGRQSSVTETTTGNQNHAIQVQQTPTSPQKNKLAPANGGLIFLPALKPTDGVVNLAAAKSGDTEVAADAAAMHEKPLLLDRAVAVINGEVIMASDVEEQQRFAVFEPYSVPGGEFTPMRAMQQIVNRTLLLDQMDEQQLVTPPTDADVDKQIAELREHMPACAGQHCETEEGWRQFLAAHGYTEANLHGRWKQRMQILDFVSARFRTGIRITKPEIETYYKEKLAPEFEKRKLKPPPLAQVYERIDEVLLQQHVNVLLSDYLRSLKDAGSVQILDPQYNTLGNSPATNASNSGGDVPGAARHGGEQ